jgi:hypothetical protein
MHYTLRLGSERGPLVATSLVARYRSRERDEAVQTVAGDASADGSSRE